MMWVEEILEEETIRKEIKKIMAATLGLSIIFGAGNAINSSAASALSKRAFSFYVKPERGKSHTQNSMYRTASSSDNAWMVNFKASDETANGRTSTIFYLGIVNKNGKNGYGSGYRTVREGSGPKYFSPYDKTYKKDIVLYAMDNKDGSLNGYSISGYWTAQSGKYPIDEN
ncbi:putative uncharacterized protein [Clostridium sp. CAG:122]|uniref:DUF2712 domain-containing protein n=1 Tax=Butyribacter sp. TaxID=2822465 RepID=UPI00033EDDE0|nr:putative uncharacterized protein [Clostridium sp. CAG:122]